jgi:hypothetical protein
MSIMLLAYHIPILLARLDGIVFMHPLFLEKRTLSATPYLASKLASVTVGRLRPKWRI